MQGLLVELSDLSKRNDELMTAKDADLVVIRDLDNQLKDYKRKYEQAKTELRSVKGTCFAFPQLKLLIENLATSQLFLPAPKNNQLDDQLPVAPDGGVLDIHVTSFLSSVDSLLTAGRSNAPTRVLAPMKAVVNSVTSIIEDVQAFERRSQRDPDIDLDALRLLRERAETTLSNLTTASKTHATSSGLSPVSLLDAAASHVSATITDICKTVCIRKATSGELEQFSSYSNGATATNGFSPALRSVEEKPIHQRNASSVSTRSIGGRYGEGATSSSRSYGDVRRRPPSDNSSSDKTNSPPPLFDQPKKAPGIASDDTDGSEDNWAELKVV